ncbi:hypothetical protein F5J12DRAFT_786585 [Pisolithus orientalis]|uniref:uncharacterized protein n=1 Tax=Pisolithus orientalis TaxID=936130 RepID=UPI002224BCC7|nr:uncharacterized protein F5J12DRAFT_786585 [Pisolithus orientalis]KAI5990058.1 hypothetical protein F5J12DRAFT_786585 [Pisolithus orientalis]
MSANHAPHLLQLVLALTPDPVEAERASLREQLAAASAGLVAEAKCVPNDWEDMWEEKVTWLRCWEEKTAILMPLVKQGKVLGVSVWVSAEDAPVLAEADDLYEQWTAEEAEAHAKVEQDIQMGEETVVELSDDGAVKMSHVEVPQPAHRSQKTIAESNKEPTWLKICIPATGMITHKEPCMQCALKRIYCTGMLGKTCDVCAKIKQGCEKSSKAAGKKAPKASPSKWGHDDGNNDIMEVVKSRARRKGKVPVCGGLDDKTAVALSRALMMVRAKAMASHTATMHLQVCINQLMEALEELGIE